jgi:hypothetical protein
LRQSCIQQFADARDQFGLALLLHRFE